MSASGSLRQWQPPALKQDLFGLTDWLLLALVGFCSLASLPVCAQVPGLLNYQGRIAVGTTAFEGTGQFKLALVNGDALGLLR